MIFLKLLNLLYVQLKRHSRMVSVIYFKKKETSLNLQQLFVIIHEVNCLHQPHFNLLLQVIGKRQLSFR